MGGTWTHRVIYRENRRSILRSHSQAGGEAANGGGNLQGAVGQRSSPYLFNFFFWGGGGRSWGVGLASKADEDLLGSEALDAVLGSLLLRLDEFFALLGFNVGPLLFGGLVEEGHLVLYFLRVLRFLLLKRFLQRGEKNSECAELIR